MENKELNYKVNISSFTPGEELYFGIFVSHSNADNTDVLYPLTDDGIAQGIDFIFDRNFLANGDDFKRKILRYINCYAGVSVITSKSINSPWVNYELGMLASMDIPVFIYDPEKLLTETKVLETINDQHIRQFAPTYSDRQELYDDLKKLTIYKDLYTADTTALNPDKFNTIFNEKCDKVMIRIECDEFEKYKEYFSQCEYKILLINFGLYDALDRSDNRFCERCKKAGQCYGEVIKDFNDENVECCLLNKVLNSGKIFFEGDDNIYEKENQDKAIFTKSTLMLHLPIHKKYGVTFKILIDAPTDEVLNKILSVLEGTDFNPTFSKNENGGRIYLSIVQKKTEGLYRCVGPFCNNYLCSYAIKDPK